MNPTRTRIIGCGYLGLRVARQLLDRGDVVLGTTRSPDRAGNLAAIGIEPVIFDVLDPGEIPPVDRVLHCVGFDRSSGRSIREVYVDGLRRTLDRLGTHSRTLVYASSTGVYGGDDGDWVDEATPPDPRTESGRACLDAEGVVRDWESRTGGAATVLRFAGLFGPDRVMRRDSLLRGEPVVGDPAKFLNLVHIDDAAAAAVAALDRGRTGGLFLIADDRPTTREEFYRLVAATLGAPPPQFERPEPGSPESRREESNKRVGNARMHAELLPTLRYPDILTGVPAALGVAPRTV